MTVLSPEPGRIAPVRQRRYLVENVTPPPSSPCRCRAPRRRHGRNLRHLVHQKGRSSGYGSNRKPDDAIARRVAWLNRLRDHIGSADYASRDSLLCGDFNVTVRTDGPPRQPRYSVREQDALDRLLGLGFVDLYRAAHPAPLPT